MLLDLLKIPPIAPDEDILGWIYAIADANSWDHFSFIAAFFPDCYPPVVVKQRPTRVKNYYIRSYTKYYAIYEHLGFPSPQDMLMSHTEIPVSGLLALPEAVGLLAEVSLNGSNVEIEPTNRPNQKQYETDILEHSAFRYCPVCAKEDMETYGRPVAHIPHQAMRRDFYGAVCYKHGAPLVRYEEIEKMRSVSLPQGTGTKEQVVEMLYRKRVVGDIMDIKGIYEKWGRESVDPRFFSMEQAMVFSPEQLLTLYDKKNKYIDLAERAAEVMGEYYDNVKFMGYSPFPFLRYECEGRREESISYILSLTTEMTCRLCGKCQRSETRV